MKVRVHLARFKKWMFIRCLQLVDLLASTDYSIRYKMKLWGFDTNDYTFEKNQIAFVHIPKTGGSSLSHLLAKDSKSRFKNLRIHRPVSKHCSSEEFQYITVLRDPVDRVWSLYQMTLKDPDGHHYRKFAEQGLKVFLEKYWASRNLYCRYFSGVVFKEPEESEKELALKSLLDFKEVLSFDNLEDDINSFLTKYEIEATAIPHLRKSKNKKASEEERRLISEYNKLDISLYQEWLNKKVTIG